MLPSLQACLCYFAHALATLRARRSQARDSSFKASQVRATIKDIKAAAAAAKEKAREDDVANLMRQRCRRGAAMPQRRLELEDTAAPAAAAERATSDEEDGDDEDAADEREWGAFFDALPKGAPDFLTLPECAPAGAHGHACCAPKHAFFDVISIFTSYRTARDTTGQWRSAQVQHHATFKTMPRACGHRLKGVMHDELGEALDEQQLRKLLEQCTANEFAKMGWTSPPPLQAKTVGKMGRVAPAPATQAMCDAAVAGASGMQWPWKLVARRVRNRGRALAPLHWTSSTRPSLRQIDRALHAGTA